MIHDGPDGPMRASFTWRGRTLSVTVPEASYVFRLGEFMGIKAGALPGDEHFAIAPVPGGETGELAWSWRHGAGVAWSKDDAIASLLTIMCFQYLAIDGCYALHAGAITVDGKARLVLGPGHAGKSTLVAEAWLHGYEVLGDDYLVLDAGSGRIEAVPKPVKLRLQDPELPRRFHSRVAQGDYCIGLVDGLPVVKLARTLPGMAPLGRSYAIDAIYLLQRPGRSETSMSPAPKYQAVQAILEQTFVGRLTSLGIIDHLAPAIRGGRVHILSAGENDGAGALAALTAPL